MIKTVLSDKTDNLKKVYTAYDDSFSILWKSKNYEVDTELVRHSQDCIIIRTRNGYNAIRLKKQDNEIVSEQINYKELMTSEEIREFDKFYFEKWGEKGEGVIKHFFDEINDVNNSLITDAERYNNENDYITKERADLINEPRDIIIEEYGHLAKVYKEVTEINKNLVKFLKLYQKSAVIKEQETEELTKTVKKKIGELLTVIEKLKEFNEFNKQLIKKKDEMLKQHLEAEKQVVEYLSSKHKFYFCLCQFKKLPLFLKLGIIIMIFNVFLIIVLYLQKINI